MTWYVFRGFDVAGSGEKRRVTRPLHIARLEALRTEGRLLTAGPLLAIDPPPGVGRVRKLIRRSPGESEFVGSLLVLAFDSLEAAQRWADAEPYLAAGVYDRITIDPYLPALP